MEKGKDAIRKAYVVNDDCIGCAICSEVAPENFSFDHDQGCARVCKQPATEKEASLCAEAMDICPVEAIEAADTVPAEVGRA